MNKEKPIEMLRKVRNQINQAIDKLEIIPNVNRIDYERKYELGTQHHFPNGAIFKYGKVDFGILAKPINGVGGDIRSMCYKWFAWNAIAKLSRHQL